MTYIINTQAIILIMGGKTVRVEKTDKKYPQVIDCLKLPKDEQEDAIKATLDSILNPVEVLQKTDGFQVVGDDILYKGSKLPTAFAKKVMSIIRDDLPLTNFERFWENLEQNPSYHVVNETGFFDFLDYRELPITDDGCFLAYRGVGDDYWSLSGNKETKVLQGQVNESGQVYNGIGEVIEVARNGVCDDRNVHCAAHSLHIGSLDYARGWGNRVIIVKVNPKDVVSVPNDCQAQKCRVCKFEVIADFVEEITTSVVDEKGQDTLVPDNSKERNAFIDRIDTYLSNKIDLGWETVSIRQIQNALSPNWATKTEVYDALQELGYYFDTYEEVVEL